MPPVATGLGNGKSKNSLKSRSRDFAFQTLLCISCLSKGHCFASCIMSMMYTSEVSMDRIRIGYTAGYLRYFWIRFGFGYLFLKKLGQDSIRIFV